MLGRLLGYVGMPRLACGAAVRWYVGMLLLVNLLPLIPYPPTARGPVPDAKSNDGTDLKHSLISCVLCTIRAGWGLA